ncbi:MAG: hypothetical protein IKY83_10430 [Proteobacteria bacterium]|nr:hypothetical protein [Pseudomonadota bacterium]
MGFVQWFMIHVFRKKPKALAAEVVVVETETADADDAPRTADETSKPADA